MRVYSACLPTQRSASVITRPCIGPSRFPPGAYAWGVVTAAMWASFTSEISVPCVERRDDVGESRYVLFAPARPVIWMMFFGHTSFIAIRAAIIPTVFVGTAQEAH